MDGIAGSAMEKPASGWFLHWASTTRVEEHMWGIFREHVLQHFEASNYQSVLREKLQRLKQTADIENYNGEYSALIFRVEGMSPRTRSYVKLENPETLSDAMGLAVKFEVAHFVEDASERKVRHEQNKTSNEQAQDNKKTSKGKPFRGKGRFKPRSNSKRKETRTCHFCNMPGHVKANCFSWKKEQEKQGNRKPHCGATTIYVSKRWVEEHQLKTTRFDDKNIRVKLGDNQIVEAQLELLPLSIAVSGLDNAYECVAVVYAIPEEFDCILGIPFFEDMQPQIDWRSRRVEGTKVKTLHWKRSGKTCGPTEEGGPVIASVLRRSVGAPDSRRGAALETNVKSTVKPVRDPEQRETPMIACEQLGDASAGKGSAGEDERKSSGRDDDTVGNSSVRGKESVVEKMFTMGVTDEAGVQAKFITRKKLRKFLRIKTESIAEPDFMLVLTNDMIKNVARSLERRDQPDNLTKYKDTVFRPDHPEGLPKKSEIEHRIDVKDPNLAMYRQQWRQSPEQQREIVLWVEDMRGNHRHRVGDQDQEGILERQRSPSDRRCNQAT
ncbi:hypothetical protein P3T76_002125 [Phytophthora citrophthora]|uniref:Ty3 transposon capsid-like protein domain-containing protein n=1 Tax=Phytophthora citrophthora TaxID=4793 RepID=A0AAD9GYG7_9STRA|nr:hypothetical protein P3T76_002125 [Phytophthora citrophthora]